MAIDKLHSRRPGHFVNETFSRPLPFCPTLRWLVHTAHIRVRLETWAALIGDAILTLMALP